jgi:hypothetical protein
MQALLAAIVTWLSVNFSLPANYDLPAIEFATPMEIAKLRYGAFDSGRQGTVLTSPRSEPAASASSVVSVYKDKDRVIVLPVGWQGITPAELSILVHEMVHHLQNVGKLTFACPQEREALAYKAQDQWLQLFGKDLAGEFELDGFTILVKSRCINLRILFEWHPSHSH